MGEARVGVLGLGYVGLPVALSFAEAGLRVLGFDIDGAKVEQLRAGSCYVRHLDAARLRRALDEERFQPTGDFSRLGEADVLVICVPTPLDTFRQPDLSYVEATVRQIAETLRPGQLIILESTTYPGTTDDPGRRRSGRSGKGVWRRLLRRLLPGAGRPGQRALLDHGYPQDLGRGGRGLRGPG